MSNNLPDSREKKGASGARNTLSIIFMSLVAIMTLTFSIVLLIKNASLQRETDAVKSELDTMDKEHFFTEGEMGSRIEEARIEAAENADRALREDIKKRLEEGEGPNSIFKSLFPNQLVVARNNRYYFFPISDKIARHGFKSDDFEFDEKGFLRYRGENKDFKYKQGIDVSRFQGKIDWAKVKNAGIEFAIIRACYRGITEGLIIDDETFEDNIKGATENGIDVGVYVYSQAINKEEALEEANHVIEMIQPYKITYPVVIDIESADSDNARTLNLSAKEYEEVANVFCNRVEEAGYKSMVYGNLLSFTVLMNAENVDNRDIWFAQYNSSLYYPYHFNIWQYTASGKVPGIEKNVDLNICITEY